MIHPTAIIHPRVELDVDVEIGPYSVIGEGVRIGKGTKVGPHVVIEGLTTIGTGCRIYQFASIGAPPQDLKFKGEPSEAIIGDGNTIREFVTINRATSHGGGKTVIGNNNLLMAYAHVAHDCRIGNNCVLANAATLAGHIGIDDYAIVGGLVAIHQFVRVGSYSLIGGASAVTLDVPPYTIAVGNRARLHGLNKVGLRRHGFTREEIDALNKAYRIIFRCGLTLEDALRQVEDEGLRIYPHVSHLVDFIKASKRGVSRPRNQGSGVRGQGDESVTG